MKINIKNFGPIKEIELDLDKNMTLIFGKNNIGKSYSISILYLILKVFMKSYPSYYVYTTFEKNAIDNLNSSINLNNENEKDITDAFNSIVNKIILDIYGKELNSSFENTFGSLKKLRRDKIVLPQIIITLWNYKLFFIINDKIEIVKVEQVENRIILKETKGNNCKKNGINKIFIYEGKNKNEFTKFVFRLAQDEAIKIFDIIKEQINDIFYFPASRSGLYIGMNAFSQILAELSKQRSLITKPINLPGLTEPISDYFLKITTIESDIAIDKDINEIALNMEKNILNGVVKFDDKEKRIIYQPFDSELTLDLNNTSSMVSELSPVVAYLKYILNRNERDSFENDKRFKTSKPLIFIEEPEAHLHPEAQVKLVDVFNALIKKDVNLIITSHSNYIFNKLNNLVLEKKLSPEEYAPMILKDSEKGSIGSIMDISELGVYDENFIDISEQLYEEREDILDRLNEAVDNDK